MNQLLIRGYTLISQANGTDYKFITKDFVTYNAVFGSAGEFFPGTTFAKHVRLFAIRPAPGSTPTPGTDPLIAATLVDIFELEFLKNKEAVILYICDDSDKKELVRLRKFDRVFDNTNIHNTYKKSTFSDKQAAAYGGVICLSSNPDSREIIYAAQHIPDLFA